MRKFMFVEMEDNYWDIYEMVDGELNHVTDIVEDDLPNYLECFRTLDFDVTIRTYKSFDLMWEEHLKVDNDKCESLMGGLYDNDPPCVVCDERQIEIENYSKKVGVKQNV